MNDLITCLESPITTYLGTPKAWRLPLTKSERTTTHTYLCHAAQVISLQVVALLGGQLVHTPHLVRVAVMLFHHVLPGHGHGGQVEAGRRRDGRHICGRHFWSETQSVIRQLKREPGLRACEKWETLLSVQVIVHMLIPYCLKMCLRTTDAYPKA